MFTSGRSFTLDDRRAIVSAVSTMIPSAAALLGWRYVNPSMVDGLLQAASEARGLDPASQVLRELEKELLDWAFPHQVELTQGPWLHALPRFVHCETEGLCCLYLFPFDEGDASLS